MHQNFRVKTARAAIGLLFLGHAQTSLAADAGQQLNQIERIQDQREPLRAPPTIEPEESVSKPSQEGARATFTQFEFEGNHLFTSAQLHDHLKGYLNREISFDELKLAVDSLAIYYKEHGYLATASLPSQDVASGRVRVIIVEAKFGGAKVDADPNSSSRVEPETIQRFIEANNPPGEVLNLNTLDRAAIIANELPGVGVMQTLKTGAREGETDALLMISNRSAYVASVSVDNYGFHSTGPVRYLANASLLSPLKIGDRVDLTYLYSTGNNYGRVAYSRPIGYSGFRLGMNASALKYEVVAGAGASLKPEGAAETIELEATYPTSAQEQSASRPARHSRRSTLGIPAPPVSIVTTWCTYSRSVTRSVIVIH